MANSRTAQVPQQAVAGRAAGRAEGGRFAKGQSGNPHGARRQRPSTSRADGWTSLLSGLGTLRDKREHVAFVPSIIDPITAENLYRGDDLAARIIETLPKAGTRQGFDLHIVAEEDAGPGVAPTEIDADGRARATGSARRDFETLKKEVEHRWSELGLVRELFRAWCYARAYGGAAILIGVDDGNTNLAEPLAVGNVRSLDHLTTLEAREIQPIAWYGNPQARKFGKPAIYQLTPQTTGQNVEGVSFTQTIRIHETRLIIFDGVRVSRRQMSMDSGWGDSILSRVANVLRDFNLSWSAAGTLVVDFAQAVFKMKGLNDLLGEDSKDIFKQRMLGMEMSRSVARATMIDADDDFTRVATPVAGLPDLLDRFTTRLAMAAELPLPLLAGESPGGLNTSGASGDQLRMFYDNAKAAVDEHIIPAMRYITQILFQTLGGEPAQWSVEARPLWQSSQTEILQQRKTQSEIDSAYLDRGVLDGVEVRKSRFGGKSFSFETTVVDEPELTAEEIAGAAAEVNAAKPVEGAEKAPAEAVSAEPVVASAKPTVEPGPVTPNASGDEVVDIQKQALSGAQISSMIAVLAAVNAKEISRPSGLAALRIGFQLSEGDAVALLGPEGFEAAAPEPASATFVGAPTTELGGKVAE